jgi:hypothetical protein
MTEDTHKSTSSRDEAKVAPARSAPNVEPELIEDLDASREPDDIRGGNDPCPCSVNTHNFMK